MDSNYDRPLPKSTFIGMKPGIAKNSSEKGTDNDKLKPHERAIRAALRNK